VISGSTTKSREINDLYAQPLKALVEGFMSHQPIANSSVWYRGDDCVDHGNAGTTIVDLCAGNVSAAGVEYTNTPALVGGAPSHWLNKRSEKMEAEPGRRVRSRGVIIASGLMAGGALGEYLAPDYG
jgi:hypothetical protein